MDYEDQTLLKLKKICKERGLKISGTKDEVVIRLMEHDELIQSPSPQNQVQPVQTNMTQQYPLGIQPQFMKNFPQENGQMQFSGQVAPKKQTYIFSILTIIMFAIGVLLIIWDGGTPTAGPMAVTDGCCFGSLFILCSFFIVPIAIIESTRNNNHPVVMYVQK